MKAKGWIRLHRETLESEVFTDPELYRLWNMILLRGSYQDTRLVEWDGDKVTLKAGEFITGRKALSDMYNFNLNPKFKVNESTLWSRLKKLEKMGSIKITPAPSRKYSVVSILKWDEYQNDTEEDLGDEDPPQENKEVTDMSEFLKAGEEITPAPKVDKPKKGKRVYEKGDIEWYLSSYLFGWMRKNNPNAKDPNPQKWSDIFRLMIERDSRDPEEIKAVINWSQNDSFWMNNILSPEKLRKQYDTLFMQRKADLEKKAKIQGSAGSSKGARKNDLLKEMMEREARKNEQIGNNKTLFLNS